MRPTPDRTSNPLLCTMHWSLWLKWGGIGASLFGRVPDVNLERNAFVPQWTWLHSSIHFMVARACFTIMDAFSLYNWHDGLLLKS